MTTEDEEQPTQRINVDGRGGYRPGAGRPKKTEQNDAYLAFAKAKAARETYKAKLAEIELRKRNKEMIEREPAERAAFQLWRIVSRQLVHVFPSEVAEDLSLEFDPRAVEAMLRDRLRVALERLSAMSPDEVMSL